MAANPIASGQDKKESSRSLAYSDKKGEHKSCIPAVVLKSDTFYGYGHARARQREKEEPNCLRAEQSREGG